LSLDTGTDPRTRADGVRGAMFRKIGELADGHERGNIVGGVPCGCGSAGIRGQKLKIAIKDRKKDSGQKAGPGAGRGLRSAKQFRGFFQPLVVRVPAVGEKNRNQLAPPPKPPKAN